MFYVELFALCTERSAETVACFMEHHARGLEVQQTDFAYPQFEPGPKRAFATVTDLLSFLVATHDAEYSLYWAGRNNEQVTLFFLADGSLIVDIALVEPSEDEQRAVLEKLVRTLGAAGGYAEAEAPAVESKVEFWQCFERAAVKVAGR